MKPTPTPLVTDYVSMRCSSVRPQQQTVHLSPSTRHRCAAAGDGLLPASDHKSSGSHRSVPSAVSFKQVCINRNERVHFIPGARGEADAQNITVLAMWMIEHPGTDDEHDEPHTRGGGSDSSCPGAMASNGGKSVDRSSYLCSPGDIASADASEMEEGFSERYSWKSC